MLGLLLLQFLLWMLWKENMSLANLQTSISVSAISVNKHNASESLFPKRLAHDADIRWVVKVVLSHFSYRSSVTMKSFFVQVFGQFYCQSTSKEYSTSKDKMSYYINYGTVLVSRDVLLLSCEKSRCHSVLFGKTFCLIFQDNQLDVHLRIWDN